MLPYWLKEKRDVNADRNSLKSLLAAGKVVPFVGAGASLGSGLPSGRTLARDFAQELGLDADEVNTTNLLEVASAASFYQDLRWLQFKLRRIFEEASGSPTQFHHWLATSGARLIVTTNYDDLIERAFIAAGQPFNLLLYVREREENLLLVWPPRADGYIAETKQFDIHACLAPVIYKLHGGVGAGCWHSAVITEDEYFELGGRIYSAQVVPQNIQHFLAARSMLFVGYSLRDVHVRYLMFQLKRPSGMSSFIVTLRPSRLDIARMEAFGLVGFDMSADDFVRFIDDEAT